MGLNVTLNVIFGERLLKTKKISDSAKSNKKKSK